VDERLFAESFAELPLMAILRGFDRDTTLELCELGWDLGLRLVEIPVQSPAAVDALAAAVRLGRGRGAVVGAGTVTTPARVAAARDAGAAFTVAPGCSEPVVRASLDAGLPHLAGVATATEIQRATELGLSWVKAFPAGQLGAGWFRAMHGPFPDVRFVATGGMSVTNTSEFLEAGASAVALGSALADEGQRAALSGLVGRVRVAE
jgi:2-dehydro-3-deoxyphosphogluconate aldolase / (4S)-4-hydroxy-2-oxoglutarate aldolase